MQCIFDNDKFICLIEVRSCLWDTAESDYCNKNVKQQCWTEVAKEMHGEFEELSPSKQYDYVKDLQKRWKNLRNCFARELAKQKKKGSDSSWKTYKYFEQMSFLMRCHNNSVRYERSTNSMSPSIDDNHDTDEDHPSEANSEEVIPEENMITKTNNRKRKLFRKEQTPDNTTEVMKFIKDSIRETNERRLDEDEDRHFLLSLLRDFKRVHPEKKLDVKLEIMQVIREASLPMK